MGLHRALPPRHPPVPKGLQDTAIEVVADLNEVGRLPEPGRYTSKRRQLCLAVRAGLEVGLQTGRSCGWQLAVEIRRQLLFVQPASHVCSSPPPESLCQICLNAMRALLRRDLTVPIGSLKASAISE